MSTLISEQDIYEFNMMEDLWLQDEGSFDEFWEKKLDDEKLLFNWMQERFEQTAAHFTHLSGLQSTFYSKLVDMLSEAAMTGFFFGELRWNKDIKSMLENAMVSVSGEA